MNRRILEGPQGWRLLRGMDRMAGLLRPTLDRRPAPWRSTVWSAAIRQILTARQSSRGGRQLADPFEDMGAMLIRHLAWRVFDREEMARLRRPC